MKIADKLILLLLTIVVITACNSGNEQVIRNKMRPDSNGKIVLSNDEWAKILPDVTYSVMRERETERPYTGKLLKNKEKGIYACRACGLPLFSSETKYDSKTGWPSFYQPIERSRVTEELQRDGRTEVCCARCDGHLGHVFTDGPKPTGRRYCMNSVALSFEKK